VGGGGRGEEKKRAEDGIIRAEDRIILRIQSEARRCTKFKKIKEKNIPQQKSNIVLNDISE